SSVHGPTAARVCQCSAYPVPALNRLRVKRCTSATGRLRSAATVASTYLKTLWRPMGLWVMTVGGDSPLILPVMDRVTLESWYIHHHHIRKTRKRATLPDLTRVLMLMTMRLSWSRPTRQILTGVRYNASARARQLTFY